MVESEGEVGESCPEEGLLKYQLQLTQHVCYVSFTLTLAESPHCQQEGCVLECTKEMEAVGKKHKVLSSGH